MLFLNKPVDFKICVYGMSCVGKTTFAKSLRNHNYIGFDENFPWHYIETFNQSISSSLQNISEIAKQNDNFVIDGWHLSDLTGKYLPKDVVVYLIYANYKYIIDNYRVPIYGPEGFYNMYKNWYSGKYPKSIRYIFNDGNFKETSENEFRILISQQRKELDRIWNQDTWTWEKSNI